MKKFEIDYYATKPSKNDEFEIVSKTWMKVVLSSDKLDENLDIFIDKKDFRDDIKPRKRDLVFFIKDFKFYTVLDQQDAGDFYIINVEKFKIRNS